MTERRWKMKFDTRASLQAGQQSPDNHLRQKGHSSTPGTGWKLGHQKSPALQEGTGMGLIWVTGGKWEPVSWGEPQDKTDGRKTNEQQTSTLGPLKMYFQVIFSF